MTLPERFKASEEQDWTETQGELADMILTVRKSTLAPEGSNKLARRSEEVRDM